MEALVFGSIAKRKRCYFICVELQAGVGAFYTMYTDASDSTSENGDTNKKVATGVQHLIDKMLNCMK
eukprot:805950-Prorocentrum_lima.AAC.1